MKVSDGFVEVHGIFGEAASKFCDSGELKLWSVFKSVKAIATGKVDKQIIIFPEVEVVNNTLT